ncbi:MAG: three-Cys-motif partner protein TcmP [Thermoanaerobaculia bacterium]
MFEFDEVGRWSEIKLEILRKYAAAYSTILDRQPALSHFYIDGFSGPGVHISKERGEDVAGSPAIALGIRPPFAGYYFIDLDGDKINFLRNRVGGRSDVQLFAGDCNKVLVNEILPEMTYNKYRRALCVLDPYGLHLDWEVMRAAGETGTIDLILNFPVQDMNRNALWRDAERVPSTMRERMSRFWGDDSWFDASYERSKQIGLFGDEEAWLKGTNDEVAEAFRQRLKQVAGFGHVPKPLPMRNSRNAVVYYLFFATPKPVAAGIIEEIFDRYR